MNYAMALLLSYCVLAAGCNPKPEVKVQPLAGVCDGGTYTSVKGSFSVYISEMADKETLRDEVNQYGTEEHFSFRDTRGNFHAISSTQTLDLADTFLDDFMRERKDTSPNMRKNKTPDGLDCITSMNMQPDPNTGLGSAKIHFMFAKKRKIFDVIVVSRAANTPEEAQKALDEAIYTLWSNAVFRDMFQERADFSGIEDPRVRICILAAEQTADQMGLDHQLLKKGLPTMRVVLSAEKEGIEWLVGLKADPEKVYYTESITSRPEDRQKAQTLRDQFFFAYERQLAQQKLSLEPQPAAADPGQETDK
ncbi:hypothetical protein JW933_06665 [candidate division FCPU426 bacterium]|nr:hypothetical protein [candidate division FCPU426 bacterium]